MTTKEASEIITAISGETTHGKPNVTGFAKKYDIGVTALRYAVTGRDGSAISRPLQAVLRLALENHNLKAELERLKKPGLIIP